jgi:hypothetical protein
MIPQDEETHTQLMRAFNEYFKANQRWINKGTRRAGEQTRYWLAQIRIISRERRKLIQDWRHSVDAHKAQKKQAPGDADTN